MFLVGINDDSEPDINPEARSKSEILNDSTINPRIKKL